MNAVAHPAASLRSASWWPRLLMTDFRHALAPWVIYVAALCLSMAVDNPASGAFGFLVYVYLFSISAVVVQVLCTDNSYGTMATLLTFPVSRWSIIFTRMLMLAALLFLPITIAAQTAVRGSNSADLLVIVGFIASIQWSLGGFYSVMLRSRPVAWTAVMIAPFVEMMFSQIVGALFSMNPESSSLRDSFPWVSPFQFGVIVFVVVASLAGIMWAWGRMEVRQ